VDYRDLVKFVNKYRNDNPDAAKQQVASATAEAIGLTKHRSVYACADFAIRFSSASGSSFSNVVLSLSALRSFDANPFIVVLLRATSTEYFLANTTFLKKISHSSHQLRGDNVRGSFLGHDIARSYEGIANDPTNFETLFSIHQEFTWEENLERLVEATGNIVGIGQKYVPSPAQVAKILASPQLASDTLATDDYQRLKREMAQVVAEAAPEILQLAEIDNVNVRGNRIEQSITGGINEHNLADLVRHVGDVELQLEIKTKLMDRASSPKAYNVDKALKTLGSGDSLIAFCFVGINVGAKEVTASTVSIFDSTILGATRIQFHWAGRNSRGVTQLTGDLVPLFSPTYSERIDVTEATEFLRKLIDL